MTKAQRQDAGPLTAADLEQAIAQTRTAEIALGGKSAEVTYRPLKWWDRNRCISAATEYYVEKDAKGQDTLRTRFHMETYYEEALRAMLMAAPFPITTMALRNLPVEIGRQLERIVPNPLDFQIETAAKKE